MGDDTPTKKAAFLAAFAVNGMISVACKAAGCTRAEVYTWAEDPEFRSSMGAAKQDAFELLEAEAFRRAVHGVERSVYYKGSRCGVVREYSDALLMFLLSKGKPSKYGSPKTPPAAESARAPSTLRDDGD